MNWAQFKGPVCDMCVTDAAVTSWSLTQGVASSSPFNANIFVTEFAKFGENV